MNIFIIQEIFLLEFVQFYWELVWVVRIYLKKALI